MRKVCHLTQIRWCHRHGLEGYLRGLVWQSRVENSVKMAHNILELQIILYDQITSYVLKGVVGGKFRERRQEPDCEILLCLATGSVLWIMGNPGVLLSKEKINEISFVKILWKLCRS